MKEQKIIEFVIVTIDPVIHFGECRFNNKVSPYYVKESVELLKDKIKELDTKYKKWEITKIEDNQIDIKLYVK